MSSLKIQGLNKIYHSGALALYDGNLETTEKELVVILGAEGSGKSTLLRVIAGLEEASEGSIFIGGKDVTESDPKDRDIAMIFKSGTLYPTLNVYDNMAFGLKLRKASQALIEKRVAAAASILELTDFLYRKPKTLTAAQRQRVAIGRAIVREPKLYLLDEPLSGLDGALQGELLNVIINLQARMEGTFLYATKNLREALTIGTRIVVMKNGTIQQIDTPANLYDYPVNAYVAFYIGAPTINFINNARVVKRDDSYCVESGSFSLKLGDNIVKRFEKIEEYADNSAPIILGIRPEDILVKAGRGANLKKTESDGENHYGECEYLANNFVAKCEKGAKTGECELKIDESRLYLFDAETRLTLLARDGGYKQTGFADADRLPLTFGEEEQLIKTYKTKKAEKKKK